MLYQDKVDSADKGAQILQLPRLGLGRSQGFAGMKEEDRTPEASTKGDRKKKLSSHEDDPNVIVPTQQVEPMPEPESAAALVPEPESASPFVEIVFAANGDERMVHIFKRPLGAEFSKRRSGPTKVSYVDPQSYAEELGLEVGWVIRSIAGVDMSGKTFQETQAAIRDGLMALPADPA